MIQNWFHLNKEKTLHRKYVRFRWGVTLNWGVKLHSDKQIWGIDLKLFISKKIQNQFNLMKYSSRFNLSACDEKCSNFGRQQDRGDETRLRYMQCIPVIYSHFNISPPPTRLQANLNCENIKPLLFYLIQELK